MYDCVCGYPGSSQADLDEHLLQMMHIDDGMQHEPKRVR